MADFLSFLAEAMGVAKKKSANNSRSSGRSGGLNASELEKLKNTSGGGQASNSDTGSSSGESSPSDNSSDSQKQKLESIKLPQFQMAPETKETSQSNKNGEIPGLDVMLAQLLSQMPEQNAQASTQAPTETNRTENTEEPSTEEQNGGSKLPTPSGATDVASNLTSFDPTTAVSSARTAALDSPTLQSQQNYANAASQSAQNPLGGILEAVNNLPYVQRSREAKENAGESEQNNPTEDAEADNVSLDDVDLGSKKLASQWVLDPQGIGIANGYDKQERQEILDLINEVAEKGYSNSSSEAQEEYLKRVLNVKTDNDALEPDWVTRANPTIIPGMLAYFTGNNEAFNDKVQTYDYKNNPLAKNIDGSELSEAQVLDITKGDKAYPEGTYGYEMTTKPYSEWSEGTKNAVASMQGTEIANEIPSTSVLTDEQMSTARSIVDEDPTKAEESSKIDFPSVLEDIVENSDAGKAWMQANGIDDFNFDRDYYLLSASEANDEARNLWTKIYTDDRLNSAYAKQFGSDLDTDGNGKVDGSEAIKFYDAGTNAVTLDNNGLDNAESNRILGTGSNSTYNSAIYDAIANGYAQAIADMLQSYSQDGVKEYTGFDLDDIKNGDATLEDFNIGGRDLSSAILSDEGLLTGLINGDSDSISRLSKIIQTFSQASNNTGESVKQSNQDRYTEAEDKNTYASGDTDKGMAVHGGYVYTNPVDNNYDWNSLLDNAASSLDTADLENALSGYYGVDLANGKTVYKRDPYSDSKYYK